jgi:hypothetical protein
MNMLAKGGRFVRRLHPPTLTQWTCAHQWKTTTSRPGKGEIIRTRYLTCQRCGVKVKTEERLTVPWDQGDFMALVAQTFPEGAVVNMATLKSQGLLGESLSQLHAYLVSHGWQLELVRDQGRVGGAVRRRVSADAVEDTNGELDKSRKRRHSEDGC